MLLFICISAQHPPNDEMLCCPFNIAQPNPKNAYQQLININQQQTKSNQTQITMRFRFISYMIKKKKSSLFVQVPILPIPFPTLLPSLHTNFAHSLALLLLAFTRCCCFPLHPSLAKSLLLYSNESSILLCFFPSARGLCYANFFFFSFIGVQ